jgi:hypothetical protein
LALYIFAFIFIEIRENIIKLIFDINNRLRVIPLFPNLNSLLDFLIFSLLIPSSSFRVIVFLLVNYLENFRNYFLFNY